VKELIQEKEPPEWKGEHRKIDLSNYLSELYYTKIDFSIQNNDYVLVRSIIIEKTSFYNEHESEVNIIKRHNEVVIDRENNIHNVMEDNNKVKSIYHEKFPYIFYRQKNESFLKGSKSWRFSQDGKYGVSSKRSYQKNIEQYTEVEFWDLEKNRILWRKDYKFSRILLLDFLKYKNNSCILLAGPENTILVLMDNGDIINDISYNNPSDYSTFSPSLFNIGFYASGVSYNSTKQWIACGDFNSRRVRIFSIKDTIKLVSELNSNDDPSLPWGGVWWVDNIEFNENGKYMVIEYSFSGRGTSVICEPTEVYNVDIWKICWEENKLNVREVTISPDGKKIAYLRDYILEEGDLGETE